MIVLHRAMAIDSIQKEILSRYSIASSCAMECEVTIFGMMEGLSLKIWIGCLLQWLLFRLCLSLSDCCECVSRAVEMSGMSFECFCEFCILNLFIDIPLRHFPLKFFVYFAK